MSKTFYGGLYDDDEDDDKVVTTTNTTNTNSNSNNNTNDNKSNNKKDNITLTPTSGVRIPPKLQAQALRNKSQKKPPQTNKSTSASPSPSPSQTPTHNNIPTPIIPSSSSSTTSSTSKINKNNIIDEKQELILHQQQNNQIVANELLIDFQDDIDKIIDEYDPFIPNDYEKILKEREKLEREKQLKEDHRLQYQKELQQLHSNSGSSNNNGGTQLSSINSNNEQFSKTPTKILLLLNIATKKEVDQSLEEEMQEECKTFGKVNSVVIYPVLSSNVPPNEEVRIFIYFDSADSCKAAYAKLNNRYFAERKVSAFYYKEILFFRNKLEPFA